jgi:hypothetical protein
MLTREAPVPLFHAPRRRPAQAAFEFVVVLWIFMAFFLLAVDLAVWMHAHVSAANAAREGARFAALGCPPAGGCSDGTLIEQRIKQRSSNLLDGTGQIAVWWRDVNPNSSPANKPGRGDSFVVRIEYPHSFLFVPAGLGTVPIAACAEMVVEASDLGYAQLANTGTDGVVITTATC